MIRPSALLMLCLALLLPMAAVARLDGPLEVTKPGKVRDLAEIRSSRTLRVLVNQSRNSSGEVQGQAIGVEYHRLRAFEQYLNGHARDGQLPEDLDWQALAGATWDTKGSAALAIRPVAKPLR